MKKPYSSKKVPKKNTGPSDLTIKRILAFSKALSSNNESPKSKDVNLNKE